MFRLFRRKRIRQEPEHVYQIREHARNWHLVDRNVETLKRMRNGILEGMAEVEDELKAHDDRYNLLVAQGRALQVEQIKEEIEHWLMKWEQLAKRLESIDEALQERHLFNGMAKILGGERRARFLERFVLVMIAIVVALTLADLSLSLPENTRSWIRWTDLGISLFLIGEFFLRMSQADSKRWFFRRYWIDLAASIPFQELLRFGRLARLTRFARVLRLLRLARVILFIFRGMDRLFATFELALLKRSLLVALGLLFVGALSIGYVEGGNEASLQNMDESLWWSFATVVTGGYADIYDPVTVSGRLITVGLVLIGLTVTGIFTASLTSILVEDDSGQIEHNQRSIDTKLNDIATQLELMANETNQGLIALETVSQALSNQPSRIEVARVLTETLMRDFASIEVAVYLLDGSGDGENGMQPSLVRLYQVSQGESTTRERLELGQELTGKVIADLLAEPSLSNVDLEPETGQGNTVETIIMVCPLVARLHVLGAIHIVLPGDMARFYLYNRVPMTLAHHAALAFYGLKD